MSIEAINWALKHAHIPPDRRDSSSLAVVLIGLANHADPDGRNAFPSLTTLAAYTRLSERSVRYALRKLEQLELIQPADPRIVAAHVQRADRRPNGYDLRMTTEPPRAARRPAHDRYPAQVSDRQQMLLADLHEGQRKPPRAANSAETRGRPCPQNILETSLNPRARPKRTSSQPLHAPPPCGHCDARPGDPLATRTTTDDHGTVRRCPNCHPAELQIDSTPFARSSTR